MDETTAELEVVDGNQPFLTDDEYDELYGLRQRVDELKRVRSEAFDAIDQIKGQLDLIQNQFEGVQQSIRSTAQQLDAKFQELMAKRGISAGPVSVSDTSPHYITVGNPNQ